MGAEGSEFESRCPDFFMPITEIKLPYLTFLHHPCSSAYTLRTDGQRRTILSPEITAPVDFSSLVLSVQYIAPENGWLMTEVQVLQGTKWSKFFKLAFYSARLNHSFDTQEDGSGQVYVDVLQVKSPAQAYRFRLTLEGGGEAPDVSICLTASDTEPDACAAILPPDVCQVPVQPVSQMQLAVSDADRARLCSPTSLTMALNALGVAADALDTAAAVFDDRARVYGNWTFNTVYAVSKGLFACVTRFQKLSQLEAYIGPESLVAATISYERGELTGSAVSHTPGHLVLICGWNDGKIRVADPAAANTQEVIRFYDAAEFARAWLVNKRGAAYLVRKK